MSKSNSGLFHGTAGDRASNSSDTDNDISLPANDAQLKHIFRDAPGHLPDTPENRSLLIQLARDSSKFLGNDKYGNSWNIETTSDGLQNWVEYRNGIISEGGQNKSPRSWNSETGLNNNPVKRRR